MTRTARELAEALKLQLEGDGSVEVRGVASPERAGPHDLIYAESEKYAGRVAASAALCVVASNEVRLAGRTILRCANLRTAFARGDASLVGRALIAAGIPPTVTTGAS